MAEKKTAKVQTNTPAKKTMTKKARQTTKTKGGKPQKRLNRRTALITGASAGIGLDYATLLAEQGFDLVITARRKDRLQSLADRLETSYGVNIHIFPEDLSDPRAPTRLVEKITKEGLTIDFLVNNAGYTVPGNFDMAKWQSHADMLQTMLTRTDRTLSLNRYRHGGTRLWAYYQYGVRCGSFAWFTWRHALWSGKKLSG
jgi:NAD(P)-dependent dehydrogenase (short-subunit alcohol dehydrogenase family)